MSVINLNNNSWHRISITFPLNTCASQYGNSEYGGNLPNTGNSCAFEVQRIEQCGNSLQLYLRTNTDVMASCEYELTRCVASQHIPQSARLLEYSEGHFLMPFRAKFGVNAVTQVLQHLNLVSGPLMPVQAVNTLVGPTLIGTPVNTNPVSGATVSSVDSSSLTSLAPLTTLQTSSNKSNLSRGVPLSVSSSSHVSATTSTTTTSNIDLRQQSIHPQGAAFLVNKSNSLSSSLPLASTAMIQLPVNPMDAHSTLTTHSSLTASTVASPVLESSIKSQLTSSKQSIRASENFKQLLEDTVASSAMIASPSVRYGSLSSTSIPNSNNVTNSCISSQSIISAPSLTDKATPTSCVILNQSLKTAVSAIPNTLSASKKVVPVSSNAKASTIPFSNLNSVHEFFSTPDGVKALESVAKGSVVLAVPNPARSGAHLLFTSEPTLSNGILPVGSNKTDSQGLPPKTSNASFSMSESPLKTTGLDSGSSLKNELVPVTCQNGVVFSNPSILRATPSGYISIPSSHFVLASSASTMDSTRSLSSIAPSNPAQQYSSLAGSQIKFLPQRESMKLSDTLQQSSSLLTVQPQQGYRIVAPNSLLQGLTAINAAGLVTLAAPNSLLKIVSPVQTNTLGLNVLNNFSEASSLPATSVTRSLGALPVTSMAHVYPGSNDISALPIVSPTISSEFRSGSRLSISSIANTVPPSTLSTTSAVTSATMNNMCVRLLSMEHQHDLDSFTYPDVSTVTQAGVTATLQHVQRSNNSQQSNIYQQQQQSLHHIHHSSTSATTSITTTATPTMNSRSTICDDSNTTNHSPHYRTYSTSIIPSTSSNTTTLNYSYDDGLVRGSSDDSNNVFNFINEQAPNYNLLLSSISPSTTPPSQSKNSHEGVDSIGYFSNSMYGSGGEENGPQSTESHPSYRTSSGTMFNQHLSKCHNDDSLHATTINTQDSSPNNVDEVFSHHTTVSVDDVTSDGIDVFLSRGKIGKVTTTTSNTTDNDNLMDWKVFDDVLDLDKAPHSASYLEPQSVPAYHGSTQSHNSPFSISPKKRRRLLTSLDMTENARGHLRVLNHVNVSHEDLHHNSTNETKEFISTSQDQLALSNKQFIANGFRVDLDSDHDSYFTGSNTEMIVINQQEESPSSFSRKRPFFHQLIQNDVSQFASSHRLLGKGAVLSKLKMEPMTTLCSDNTLPITIHHHRHQNSSMSSMQTHALSFTKMEDALSNLQSANTNHMSSADDSMKVPCLEDVGQFLAMTPTTLSCEQERNSNYNHPMQSLSSTSLLGDEDALETYHHYSSVNGHELEHSNRILHEDRVMDELHYYNYAIPIPNNSRNNHIPKSHNQTTDKLHANISHSYTNESTQHQQQQQFTMYENDSNPNDRNDSLFSCELSDISLCKLGDMQSPKQEDMAQFIVNTPTTGSSVISPSSSYSQVPYCGQPFSPPIIVVKNEKRCHSTLDSPEHQSPFNQSSSQSSMLPSSATSISGEKEKSVNRSTAGKTCPLCGDDKFRRYNQLIEHCRIFHHLNMEILRAEFSSKEEFLEWKNQQELRDGCPFVQRCGANTMKDSINSYYTCQYSGSCSITVNGERLLSQHGEVISGAACPAFMRVARSKLTGSVSLSYCLQHLGHE